MGIPDLGTSLYYSYIDLSRSNLSSIGYGHVGKHPFGTAVAIPLHLESGQVLADQTGKGIEFAIILVNRPDHSTT